jgi:hypothetical protein
MKKIILKTTAIMLILAGLFSFNLSGKPNGIYIVSIYDVSSNRLVKTMKFLKEN